MKFIIKIEKDDVQTYRLGENFAIDGDGVMVIFSPEAAEEFARDVELLTIAANDVVHYQGYDITLEVDECGKWHAKNKTPSGGIWMSGPYLHRAGALVDAKRRINEWTSTEEEESRE